MYNKKDNSNDQLKIKEINGIRFLLISNHMILNFKDD